MRASTLLIAILALAAPPASSQPVGAEPAAAFQSIELRGGGTVTVRYGPTRQVVVRDANPDRPIRADGATLLIDRCSGECRRGHRIAVEVVTPELGRVAVSDGGRIELVGDFPRQAAIAASVSSGGTIDIRPIEAARVTAAVEQGGRILARAGRQLTASVSDGGNVTYWGDASVTSSIRRGGVVERGDAADLRRPLAGLDAALAPPPAPPVPPVPPRRAGKH